MNREGSWNATDFEEVEWSIFSWSHWHTKRSALMVERLVRRVVEEQKLENPFADTVDMTAFYNILIETWANSGEIGGPERAEEILDYMQEVYEENTSWDPLFCGPEVTAFNSVILSYARSGRPDAQSQALRVLKKLYDLHKEGRTMVSPNKETYAAVLKAFARKATPDAPKRVLNLLDHMNVLSREYPSVKPDFNCHNAYLSALIESSNRGFSTDLEAAKLSNKYLNRMLCATPEEQPDTWSFNMVLSTWSRTGSYEMVSRAEELVAQLEDYSAECGFSEKTRPNSNTYNILISCYGRSSLTDKAEKAHNVLLKMQRLYESGENTSARPDTITYNSVMNAYAKSRSKDAPQQVEKLLEEMQKIASEGDGFVKPNSRSFNTALDAWAKSRLPGSASHILKWIRKMQNDCKTGKSNIQPNKWTYNAFLQALAKTGSPTMAEDAEKILKEMNDLAESGSIDLRPDVLTMTNVIHCVALSGRDDSVEKAIAILNEMEEMHSSGSGNVRPNIFTYNCVINAAAKSKRREKAQLAVHILRRMESVALRPQTVSYNNVLNACAFSEYNSENERQEILDISLQLLNEAQKSPGANAITYQTIFRIVSSCCKDPEQRLKITKRIVEECKSDSQLTKSVMQQVRFCVNESQYKEILDGVVDHRTGKIRRELTLNARRIKMSPGSRRLFANL